LLGNEFKARPKRSADAKKRVSFELIQNSPSGRDPKADAFGIGT
jgi:hypothetical protein